MIDDRYGRLVVIAERVVHKNRISTCRCDCGTVKDIYSHHLVGLDPTRSCGCLKAETRQGEQIVCRSCGEELSAESFYKKGNKSSTRHNKCKRCLSSEYSMARRRRNEADRLAALTYYSNGTLKCACCGDGHIEFLTIDHINGDGNKHRKEIGQR